MNCPRFFVDELREGRSTTLAEAEANHAIKVLRLKSGASIEVFDGHGRMAIGVIEEIGKRSVSISVAQVVFAPNDSDGKLCIAVGLPKGDRQRIAIEKFVELGGDTLIPLDTEFGVAEVHSRNADRLHRYALEACKQCRRNRLPEIRSSTTISQLCEQVSNNATEQAPTWVLHPNNERSGVETVQDLSRRYLVKHANQCLFVIGPEGGFSGAEVDQLLNAGAKPLSLGNRILRVESAVAAACLFGRLWLGR